MGHVEIQNLYNTYGVEKLGVLLADVASAGPAGADDVTIAALLAASHANPQLVVNRVVENIVLHSHFRWTGTNKGERGLLADGEGDCRSLASGAARVLQALDIEAQVSSYSHEFVIGREGVTLIDGQTGNIDGKWWRFENHHWLHTASQDYDLLMGGGPVDASAWHNVIRTEVADGLTWLLAEGLAHPVYVADPASGYSYTMDQAKALVFHVPGPRTSGSRGHCDIL
ncbi:hypothetical protein [Streptomyces sp. NPDC085932]|uniref:hypothetical protein n=1 Tax=Streptomyces sp. NPDC085932 TaxID=3365741 RepID=UPI0037D92A51